jgi:hypothetical protein
MRPYYPDGKRLPALERAILRYRAFEMMIILFYVEELKSFLLGSLRATDRNRLPEGTRDLYKKMWAILVKDRVLSQTEADELKKLTDYRNRIAHEIQNLTFDISREGVAADYVRFKGAQYDHGALKRLEHYRQVIPERMRRRFVLVLGFDEILFDSAKTTYKLELKRLDKIIRRLIRERKAKNINIRSELENFDQAGIDRCGHPENIGMNGRLTAQGVNCCYSLFRSGASDLAVSYLMRVSLSSIRARRKRWLASQALG